MTNCRSCGAEIEFVIAEKSGKYIPIDATPFENGNLLKTKTTIADGQVEVRVRMLHKDEEAPVNAVRYRSHFVSCKDAKMYRRK